MKPLALSALLLVTTASAAPLLHSTASVFEGNFCRTYGCQLARRSITAPDRPESLTYSYNLRGGGDLSVIRSADKSIESATLAGPDAIFTSAVGTAFTKSFIGVTLQPQLVRECLRKASPDGFWITTGSFPNDLGWEAICYRFGTRKVLTLSVPYPRG